MRKEMRIWCVLLLCFLGNSFVQAQVDTTRYKQLLLEQEAKLMRIWADSSTRVKHVQYQTEVVSHENEVTLSETDLFQSGNFLHFYSEAVDIYRDEENTFYILKDQRLIFWTSSIQLENLKTAQGLTGEFRKQMIETSHIVDVWQEDEEPQVSRIKLRPDEQLKEEALLDIEFAVMDYNERERSLVSSTLYFNKDYKYRKMKTTLLKNELLNKKSFRKAVIRNVLNAQDQPTGEYYGFKLIDQRNA